MKHPFTNATLSSRRKGREQLAPTPQNHPARETIIVSPESALPVQVHKKLVAVPEDPMAKMQEQLAKMMAEHTKAKKEVPKSRILSLSQPSVAPQSDIKEYSDVLAMLLGKK